MDHHFAGKPMSAGQFSGRADIDHMPDTPYRGAHHRRAQSETFFRFPDDILIDADADVDIDFNLDILSDNTSSGAAGAGGGGGPMDMAVDSSKSKDSNNCGTSAPAAAKPKSVGPPINHFRSLSVDADFFEGLGFSPAATAAAAAVAAAGEGSDGGGKRMHHHRHSNSMDGSTTSFEVESMSSDGAKKALGPDKLAELALMDPKRAKRILANRQSAARSKERKIRYTNELEKKVQTLQTEATTLSAQVTMLQRDTTGLTTENKELKLRLHAMEQQASLREALNEALREEVQRLKIATGQIPSVNGNSFNRGVPQFSPSHPQTLHHFGAQQQQQQQQQQQLHMPQSSANNQPLNGQPQPSFLDFNRRV